MSTLSDIRFLGTFCVGSGNAARCSGIGEAGRECVGFLFQNRNQTFDRLELVERFWTYSNLADAKAGLNSMTSRLRVALRQMIGSGVTMESDNWSLGVYCDKPEIVDSARLEKVYDEIRQRSCDVEAVGYRLRDLYQGNFLPGLQGQWAMVERERLQSLFVRTALVVTDHMIRAKEYEIAIDNCRFILTQDPLREAVHRRIMMLRAITGEQAKMRQHFASFEGFVRTACDAAPDKRTRMLFDELCAQPGLQDLEQLVKRELA